jgi:endonuclease VIII
MPEGPEIRRAADKLKRVLDGQSTREVRFAFPQLARAARTLSGRRILAVEPRGKAMLTHFDNARSIYSHNQLYGEWAVFRGERPSTHLQERIIIKTKTHTAVLYSASDIEVLATRDVPKHPYIAKLGVELLDPAVKLSDVAAQVNDPRFARRALSGLLLDQGFLAGLGNYLRSDILFVARVNPRLRLGDLDEDARACLARAALGLTRQSYQTRGVTNDKVVAARLKAQGLSFARYRHWVFDREGEACHVCGTTIVRDDIGGRGLFFCPTCQA